MDNSLKEHLKGLEKSHISMEVRQSKEKLDHILADSFLEISSSGYKYGKKECLDDGVVLTDMTLHNYEIHPLASDAILTTYFIEDKTRKKNTLRSSIWKYIDGRWQLYFHQGTVTEVPLSQFTNK